MLWEGINTSPNVTGDKTHTERSLMMENRNKEGTGHLLPKELLQSPFPHTHLKSTALSHSLAHCEAVANVVMHHLASLPILPCLTSPF